MENAAFESHFHLGQLVGLRMSVLSSPSFQGNFLKIGLRDQSLRIRSKREISGAEAFWSNLSYFGLNCLNKSFG